MTKSKVHFNIMMGGKCYNFVQNKLPNKQQNRFEKEERTDFDCILGTK